MYRKQFLAALVIGTILLLVIPVSLLIPSQVFAQCGGPSESRSSCITCHEKEAPVSDQGEWHVIHAQKDICVNCHGGNGTAEGKALAHEGMNSQPLEDIYTDCHACHPDYETRAARFAPTLNITPSSCATPTPVPVVKPSGGQPPYTIVMPSDLARSAPTQQPVTIVLTGSALLLLFFFGLGWLARHHI